MSFIHHYSYNFMYFNGFAKNVQNKFIYMENSIIFNEVDLTIVVSFN